MKKILIVEDDQIVANIYRNKFSVEGFQVEVANDGMVGLELAHVFRPDAVILDLMLPQMTGCRFHEEDPGAGRISELPVIVFSNTYLTNMVQEAWKAGATKCLSKANCTPKQVIEVFETTLNINGGRRRQQPPKKTPQYAARKAAQSPAKTHQWHTVGTAMSRTRNSKPTCSKRSRKTFRLTLNGMRGQLQALIKSEDDAARLKHVQDLYRRIHALTGNAAVVGLIALRPRGRRPRGALEGAFRKAKDVNASSLRTVASTIDFLGLLFDRGLSKQDDLTDARILVVDDEAISRRAISHSLEKAKLKSQAWKIRMRPWISCRRAPMTSSSWTSTCRV